MSKPTNDKLQNIFNVPRKGQNIKDDEDMDLSESSDSVPFQQKAEKLNSELSLLSPLKEVKQSLKIGSEPIVEAIELGLPVTAVAQPPAPSEPTVEPEVEADPEPAIEESVMDDEIVPEPEPVVEDPKPRKQTAKEKKEALLKEQAAALPPPIFTKSNKNEFWQTTSPADKFDHFYSEKRFFLDNYLLKNGEIDFKTFYSELENASVDTNVPTFDVEELGRRITKVMQYRDRIKYIQLKINSQYFLWKESIDLFQGLLKKVDFDRGKQEGNVFEHMKDMVLYFAELEGLFQSCQIVSKHFDAAYASLSRQIAIIQPQQEYDRVTGNTPQHGYVPKGDYENNSEKSVKPMSENQKKYDSVSKPTANDAPKTIWSKLAK